MITEKAKTRLLYVYTVPFFSWMFDVFTTFYAIDCLGIAAEMNPLGWPLGAIGALIFLIPAYIFTYALLFKFHSKYAPWVAAFITMLALTLGIMNLLTGIHNIQVIQTASNQT